jgi:predicted DNA-binding transcriptional regulator AlpA
MTRTTDKPHPNKKTTVSSKNNSTINVSMEDKVFFSLKEVLAIVKKKIPTIATTNLLHFGAVGKVEFFVPIPDGIKVLEVVNNQPVEWPSYPQCVILSSDDCIKIDINKSILQHSFLDGYFRTTPQFQLVQHNHGYSRLPYWKLFDNEGVKELSISEGSLYVTREKLRMLLYILDADRSMNSYNAAPLRYNGDSNSSAYQTPYDSMTTVQQNNNNVIDYFSKSHEELLRVPHEKNPTESSDVVREKESQPILRKRIVLAVVEDSRHEVVPSLIVEGSLSISKASDEFKITEKLVETSSIAIVTGGVKADTESHQDAVLDDKAISTNDANTQEKLVPHTFPHIYTDGDVLLTIKDVMGILSLSKSTICAKMQSSSKYFDPTFPTNYLFGGRAKRFKRSEIEVWVANQPPRLSKAK